MTRNFWRALKKPIMALAPMANVTDAAFREMFVRYGRPDVFWTEFVSVEGLLSKGKKALLLDLTYHKKEHPIVAQVFGAKPEQFERVARLIHSLGFDGLDINMGCPDWAVEKQGAGAALIKNPALAAEIIRAAKRGAGGLPVSVKTRIGYHRDEIAKWIPALLKEDLAALTVHLRTRDEMSDVPAHWELAPKIVVLRDRLAPQTILLGNGDADSLDDARKRAEASGMDGVMIGRGAFGKPWFFSGKTPLLAKRFAQMAEHAALFEKRFQGKKNFAVMRKHFKAYASGFDGAKELRIKLMEARDAREVKKIIAGHAKKSNTRNPDKKRRGR